MRGRVIKGIGGFYYVSDGETVTRGNARGILKKGRKLLYVGDMVDYEIRPEDGECIITGVCERQNLLSRPPVANLDLLVVVFAAADPEPNLLTVDKLTVAALSKGIEVVICVTKGDLVSEAELRKYRANYDSAFPVFPVNGSTGEGVSSLREAIRGKNVALAGSSGVGKSTLMNCLTERSDIETGEISEKTKRGRHTTRHVEIFSLPDGTNLYDTPGFTSLDLPKMDETEVRTFFPEIAAYKGRCKYLDCLHQSEPDCAVRSALQEGRIPEKRYHSYRAMIEEVQKWRR